MYRIMKNSTPSGKIFINKLAAAERQLSAAIRLYFLEEDALAINTIANASYGIFSDLLKHRGKDESQWPFHYGLLRSAYDIAHGETVNPELKALFESTPSLIDMIEFFRDNPEALPQELSVVGSDDRLKKAWFDLRKPANFLKHADRDPKAIVDESVFENEEILVRAINASLHLNADFTPEKEFFVSAMYALKKIPNPPNEPVTIWVLMAYEPSEIMALGRHNLCKYESDEQETIDHVRAKSRMVNPFSQTTMGKA